MSNMFLKCPLCNKSVTAEKGKTSYFCTYCGAEISANNSKSVNKKVKNTNADILFERWVNTLLMGGDLYYAKKAFLEACYDDYRANIVSAFVTSNYSFSYDDNCQLISVLPDGEIKSKLKRHIEDNKRREDEIQREEQRIKEEQIRAYEREREIERQEKERKDRIESIVIVIVIVFVILFLILF